MTTYHHRFHKRLLDLFILLCAAPLALVLIGCSIVLIALIDGMPMVFRQTRIGLHGKPFTIYKLRTMRDNGFNQSLPTKLGELLRATRLDELPQLLNILNGSMSWVGPRPEQEKFVTPLLKAHPEFAARHQVKPGITGLAQIRMPHATQRDNMDKLPYDMAYIESANLLTDVSILFKTLFAILQSKQP